MGLQAGRQVSLRIVGVLAILATLALSMATPASAQSAPAPPNPSQIDENGVDQVSGKLILGSTDVAIGPGDHRGLSFSRQWVGSGWRIADIPTLSGSTNNPVVSFGGGSIPFEWVSNHYEPKFENGSTLSNDRTTFTASDGTIVTFGHTGVTFAWSVGDATLGIGTSITYPDGLVRTFHYGIWTTTVGTPGGPVSWNMGRLASVTNSAGYQVKLTYATDVGYDPGTWFRITKATAINNAVEYCSPTTACALTNSWPEVTYANWTGGGALDSVTAPANGTTTYTYNTAGKLTGVRPSGAGANLVTYGYTGDRVTSYSTGGGTWSYSYFTGNTIASHPGAASSTLYYNATGLVTSIVASGQTTSYTYCGVSEANCPQDLLKRITAPEGNYVQYAYDARGNVTSTVSAPKPSVGGASLTTLASYPATCTAGTQKICNKPTTTTDARSQVTNYDWNATHGGLNYVRMPADASGVRPETRVAYANYQAYYKNSAGLIVASGLSIVLPTQVASCRTSASCTGGLDERKTVVSYGPQVAGTANNLNAVSATVSRGDGALATTATTGYDIYGRAVTIDGPLVGTSDLTRMRFNLAGQVIGKVEPDADDAGSAKFQAVRYSYNVRGQLYLTETGTVNSQSDADWAAFSPNGNMLTEFDTYGRAVRQKVRNGTTEYQVVDTVYDTGGRVTCSITRMTPASWGTVASSCTPPQAGDRVTYNTYDPLSRLTKITSGYGTTDATDDRTVTFTSNGRVQTIKDSENNLTTYEYDGHDRLVKTRYPSPTKGANSSSTTDYEQLTYDNNSNVLTFRSRRGETQTLTYDNLNRLLIKDVPTRSGLDTAHTRDVYTGYDLLGNVTYVRFDSVSGPGITNVYDALGQLTSTTTTVDGNSRALTYQYDLAGNITRLTYPDGNYAQYHRRGSGAFNYATINSSELFYPTFDASGRRQYLYRLNTGAAAWQERSDFTWDPISRPAAIASNLAGATHDTTTTFTYNSAGQYSGSTRTNDLYAWTASAIDRAYVANGLNQYTSVGGTGVSHDANGNFAGDGASTYVYDVENRLVSRTGSGATTTLKYDPLGRLYEVTDTVTGTTRFLYNGSDLVAEYNGSGTLLRRYVHGLGAGDDPLVWFEGSGVTNAERRYLYADEQGSIVAVTDSNGNMTAINSYDEYGIPDSASNDISTKGRFRYTGQVRIPELGMYYYKARMYSPTLGRFMQADPIGYGDGMNMYAYVGNDPMNGTDPTGTTCWDEGKSNGLGPKECLEAGMAWSQQCYAPTGTHICGGGGGLTTIGATVDDWYMADYQSRNASLSGGDAGNGALGSGGGASDGLFGTNNQPASTSNLSNAIIVNGQFRGLIIKPGSLPDVLGPAYNEQQFAAAAAYERLTENGREQEVSYSVFMRIRGGVYTTRWTQGKDGKTVNPVTSIGRGWILVTMGHYHHLPYTKGGPVGEISVLLGAPRVGWPGPSTQYDLPMARQYPNVIMLLHEQAFEGAWRTVQFGGY